MLSHFGYPPPLSADVISIALALAQVCVFDRHDQKMGPPLSTLVSLASRNATASHACERWEAQWEEGAALLA